MSRSAELRIASLLVGAFLAAQPVSAHAQDEQHSYSLIPHVYELRSNDRDRLGTAAVSRTRGRLDAVLDSNIAFTKDSARLTPAADARLDDISTQLRMQAPGHLTITGYTDDLGSSQHGTKLSLERAHAAARRLGALDRITVEVEGRGEADPIVPNTTEANRAKNRRVEIHFERR